jgi:hypothetical protein
MFSRNTLQALSFLLILSLLFGQGLLALVCALLGAPHHAAHGLASAGAPPIGPQFQLRDHIGGAAQAVAVQAPYIYAGTGVEFAVVDASTIATPRRVGFVLLPDVITDLVVSGGYAYATLDLYGLAIVSIANPVAPAVVSLLRLPGVSARLAVASGYAYVVEGDAVAGVSVIAVADPRNPQLVAHLASGTYGASVAGARLYIADESAGLQIFDVRDPRAPRLLGSVHPSGIPFDAAVDGGYAYLATSTGLSVVDVTAPTAPHEVAANQSVPAARNVRLAAAGKAIVLADLSGQLDIVDITEPRTPRLAGMLATTSDRRGGGAGLAVQGHYAYIANLYTGIQIADTANPAVPVLAGSVPPTGPAFPAAPVLYQHYIYTSGQIIDTANPDHLAVAGTFGGTIEAIAGQYAFGPTADQQGLQILNLAAPTAPSLASVYHPAGVAHVYQVIVAAPYAYLSVSGPCLRGGCLDIGIEIADIGNPAAPKHVGFVSAPGTSLVGLAAVGTNLFFMSGKQLHILDVANPAAPREIGSHTFDASDVGLSIVARGSFVYVPSIGGLRIVDVSQPTKPVERDVLEIPGTMFPIIVVAGTALYIQDRLALFYADATNPAAPMLRGGYIAPGNEAGLAGYGVAVSNDTIFLAGYGLFALHLAFVPYANQVYLPLAPD